jgi:hypothetical protein
MRHLKTFAVASLLTTALLGSSAISANATTLEINGTPRNLSVKGSASLAAGTKAILKDTAGFSKNECTGSAVTVVTESPYTAAAVGGPLTILSFSGCTRVIEVVKPGRLNIVWTSGTNGTVESSEAEVKVGSAIGTLTCTTGAGTHFGTLTGVKEGNATFDLVAVVNCGIIPSAKLEATYTLAGALGVTS